MSLTVCLLKAVGTPRSGGLFWAYGRACARGCVGAMVRGVAEEVFG